MTTAVATKRLVELEATIERGLATFVEVGSALAEIRDSHLYQKSHPTFEAYCRERWGMARQTAYQLIAAVAVVENVRHGGHGTTLPTNERQVRPLTKLDKPEQQVKAWELAQEFAETKGRAAPTASDVSRAVARFEEKPPAKVTLHTKDARITPLRVALKSLREARKMSDDGHQIRIETAIGWIKELISTLEEVSDE